MKRAFTLIELVLVLAVLGLGAVLLVPVYKRARKNMNPWSCDSNLKQIGLGLMQYRQDFDGRLPPAAFKPALSITASPRPYGWVDGVQPYVKSYLLFHCTENDIARPDDPRQPNFSDYYLNLKLAGRNPDLVLKAESVILAGEGNDGHDLSNAGYARSNVPRSWANDDNSPLLRHPRARDSLKLGGYYLFLDGHAKYLQGTSPPFNFSPKPAKAKSKPRGHKR